ncbi:MAG: biopolymer transporter ExbD, partial [bacterium]
MNELNVTPMLDLCFCLLIIFMIATPVLEQTTSV